MFLYMCMCICVHMCICVWVIITADILKQRKYLTVKKKGYFYFCHSFERGSKWFTSNAFTFFWKNLILLFLGRICFFGFIYISSGNVLGKNYNYFQTKLASLFNDVSTWLALFVLRTSHLSSFIFYVTSLQQCVILFLYQIIPQLSVKNIDMK